MPPSRGAKGWRKIDSQYLAGAKYTALSMLTAAIRKPLIILIQSMLGSSIPILLMVQDGLSAACASGRVGYESTSQFSREFKRFFGRTPLEEARQMRNLLAQSPGAQPGRYVSAQ